MVRHFRLDSDGNPRAVDSSAEPEPIPEPDVLLPAQIPAISAVAEDPLDPQPGPDPVQQPYNLQRVTNSHHLSRLLSILTREGEISCLLSNAYVFRNGQLIVAPDRSLPFGKAPALRRPTAWIFLTNMK